jgi:hypothetical protein
LGNGKVVVNDKKWHFHYCGFPTCCWVLGNTQRHDPVVKSRKRLLAAEQDRTGTRLLWQREKVRILSMMFDVLINNNMGGVGRAERAVNAVPRPELCRRKNFFFFRWL